MRIDPADSRLAARMREPRIVLGIIYPTGSIYITNKPASQIANVPGNVVPGALEDISATSQELFPDEGRATIGSLDFTVVDVDGSLTDELRDQLLNQDRGVGQREVRVYTGDTDDFTDGTWRQTDTYQVVDVEYDRGGYQFSCGDIQREIREKLFPRLSTRISADFDVGDTTLEVQSTTGFQMLAHTASFSDAPSSTVGYLRVKKTGEILRYTGTATSPTRFTGLTRERFNTIAADVKYDSGADLERQAEIEEFVYLEMPAPQLMYALLTGDILGTANSLPDSWHLGIDTARVETEMFTQIGVDLYNPSDVTDGLVLRFIGLDEQDGKQFIEEQLHIPMWTFSPVTPEGKLGLRKLVRIIESAAPAIITDADNIVTFGASAYRTGEVINRVTIRWNWNGSEFTRETTLINTGSISKHGLGRTRVYELRGLAVQNHTTETLRRLFNAIVDRYGAPPIIMDLQISAALNAVEIGDINRTALANIRDFTAAGDLDRSFEIQSRRMNWRTGDLEITQFGATEASEDQPAGSAVPLSDAWYTSEGTNLSTVLTIVANAVTVSGNLPAGIYYHAGNLTINNGVTVTVNGTVQLRIRGTLTINGTIDGIGRGQAAVAEINTVGTPYTAFTYGPSLARYPQTFGSTQGSDGLTYGTVLGAPVRATTMPSIIRQGVGAIARPVLTSTGGVLAGVPTVLEGTPGAPGAPVINMTTGLITRLGSAGGASGAGLCIISRGTPVFGGSGLINLSGSDGAAPTSVALGGSVSAYPGAGGGGAPGTLLILLDGNSLVLPDLTSSFVALSGQTQQTGNPLQTIRPNVPDPTPASPWTGWSPGIGQLDLWPCAQLSTWIPSDIELGESDDEIVPAPTGLSVTGSDVGALLAWTSPPSNLHDFIEVWRATTNDRTGAVLVFRGRANAYLDLSTSVVTRYFWIRAGREQGGYSAWLPSSSTGGLSATYGSASGLNQWTPVLSGVTRNGTTFTKTAGSDSTYDAAFRSVEGYSACAIAWRFSQTNLEVGVGLTTDPATDDDFDTVDFWMYCTSGGVLGIYQNGASQGTFGSVTTSDQLAISYDGSVVRFWKNGAPILSRPLVGAVLYADSSFYRTNAAVNSVAFWQTTHVPVPAVGFAADSSGKPAGWRCIDGLTDRSQLSINNGRLQIASSPDTNAAYGPPAIPINDGKVYQLTIRHLSSAASADGLYMRFAELNTTLSAGKTHIGASSGAEAVVQANTSLVAIVPNRENFAMPGTTPITETFTYTPTSGTRMANLWLQVADPDTAGVTYTVEWVSLTELGSNIDLLPGVRSPGLTEDLLPEAATAIFSAFDAGPITRSN